jgi:TrmH family RNA methyltransferase
MPSVRKLPHDSTNSWSFVQFVAKDLITSTSNPKVKLVRALQARRRRREAEQAFVVEGVRLAEEAARARVAPRLVLHTGDLDERGQAVLQQLAGLGAPVEVVSREVMAAASGTEAPAGLLAVVPLARLALPARLTFAVALDGVADPGNLGTILRTAGAAGVEAVFLAPGTVDAYNPKVVRAAMGAHFRLPILEADWERIGQHTRGLAGWRAEAHAGQAYDQVDWRAPCLLVIGSEAAGPGEAARRLAPHTVHIPMPGRAESLNAAVAAALLMFEVARSRRGT